MKTIQPKRKYFQNYRKTEKVIIELSRFRAVIENAEAGQWNRFLRQQLKQIKKQIRAFNEKYSLSAENLTLAKFYQICGAENITVTRNKDMPIKAKMCGFFATAPDGSKIYLVAP